MIDKCRKEQRINVDDLYSITEFDESERLTDELEKYNQNS